MSVTSVTFPDPFWAPRDPVASACLGASRRACPGPLTWSEPQQLQSWRCRKSMENHQQPPTTTNNHQQPPTTTSWRCVDIDLFLAQWLPGKMVESSSQVSFSRIPVKAVFLVQLGSSIMSIATFDRYWLMGPRAHPWQPNSPHQLPPSSVKLSIHVAPCIKNFPGNTKRKFYAFLGFRSVDLPNSDHCRDFFLIHRVFGEGGGQRLQRGVHDLRWGMETTMIWNYVLYISYKCVCVCVIFQHIHIHTSIWLYLTIYLSIYLSNLI